MKIAVIGTGYVGLVTGVCLAETGNQVNCVDIDTLKIEKLINGECPIYEPGLEMLLKRNIKQERISFSSKLTAISECEVIFMALPTPPGEDGSADLSYVLSAAEGISNHIKQYTVIVNKSTVPVGTAEKVSQKLLKKIDKSLFDVVSNPEFLKEGVAVNDFMKPERIVIGSNTERATNIMKRLYSPFVRQGNPIICMDIKSAELTKYAANSFLATKISFMNEIANLCEKLGADVDQVRKGIGTDSRIGKRFLFPGVGYGGSCFPKDVMALSKIGVQHDYEFKILEAVMSVNEKQKFVLAEKIKNYFGSDLSGKTIGIWGLSFKPGTDDIRQAPSFCTIQELLNSGAKIKVYDPEALENTKLVFGDTLEYCDNQYETIKNVDALALITEWNVFRTPDYKKMKSLMNANLIFDGRNVFNVNQMRDLGFEYYSIGRPN